MQQIIKRTLNWFLFITVITTILALIGLAYLWFFTEDAELQDLPYLQWLLCLSVAEIVGTVIMFAKKGVRYLPETLINKDEKDTFRFMKEFISRGSSVTIVSNRLSWLNRAQDVLEGIKSKSLNGTKFEIITPNQAPDNIRVPLIEAGVIFFITNESDPPEARFTLINANRSGAEKLAIARGVHPEHEITVFDNNSGPQIIALAKDIIRKSKALTNG
jgi:hypothetical protein